MSKYDKSDREFRKKLRESAEVDTVGQAGVSDAAKKKAAWRDERKDAAGWISVGFTGPKAAVEAVKDAWEAFKRNNSDLWPSERVGDEETPEA